MIDLPSDDWLVFKETIVAPSLAPYNTILIIYIIQIN